MSGRKQHYIPQVLLRGFSASPQAKSAPIWVYSRLRGSYPTNTGDAATEREFYSPVQEGIVTLDDEITSYEQKLAIQLQTLKTAAEIDPSLAAETVVHLAIRNAHVRDTFENMGTYLFSGAAELLTDGNWVRDQLGVDKPIAESRIKLELRKVLSEKFPMLSPAVRAHFEAVAGAKLKENFDKFFSEQRRHISGVFSELEGGVSETAKNAHLKALTAGLVPEKRVEKLAGFIWSSASGDFILPDSVALAFNGERAKPYILANMDETDAVFFPVSSNKAVWATNCNRTLSLSGIRKICASCSRDFFVAKEETAELLALRSTIGSVATSELEALTEDAISELRKDGLRTPKTK